MAIDVIGFSSVYIMIMSVFRKYFFGSPPSNRNSVGNKDMNISHIVLDTEEKKEISDMVSQKNSISGTHRE